MKDCTRICLWSGPRNISTALMYSFAQRSDTVVYDEPLYAHYLSTSGASEYHPAAQAVLDAQPHDWQEVVQQILGPQPKPVAFFKQMTHHLVGMDRDWLAQVQNVILTRDPREMLPSFHKVVPNPSVADVGYAAQADLVAHFRKTNQSFIVLDARQVLLDPRAELTRLCKHVGIPFDEAMLSWSPGARPEDGVWAEHWYGSVHQSTGFGKYRPKDTPFPKELEALLEECLPLYESLVEGGV